jgi:hypothetical protein
MSNIYDIRLKKPHLKQESFMRSKAKRKCVCAGRRAGKTTGMATYAIEEALNGRRILEAAPTSDQTSAFWDECKKALAAPIAAERIYKNETERLLVFPNGGRIRTKTAWNADTLRGDHADLLILDEYSIMDPSAWDEVGAPMLLDNNGDAVFIFTPKRRNHAFTVYNRALGDMTGRWEAFHFTSLDNPHLSPDALAEITGDMTENAYKQEILAEFLENEGTVFRNIANCMNAPETTPEAHAGHLLVAGVDWGRDHDFTSVSVGCVSCKQEVARDRFNQVDYVVQRDRIKALWEKWRIASILVEANSIGVPNLEMMQRDHLPASGFMTTPSSKPPLIENLTLALERTEWQFQADPIWISELEAYERTVSLATGRSSYSAPKGGHDDTVISRALMVWQATNRTSIFI